MKHAYMAFALICCMPILSCSNDKEEVEPQPLPPLIRLDAVEADYTSLSFSLTCSQAEQAAYMLLTDNDPVPTASELLASGTQVRIGDTEPITVTGLAEQTDYTVVAAAGKGALCSEVQSLKMRTQSFDVLVTGTRGLGGYYAGELTGGQNGHYSLNISDIVWEDDMAMSAGYQFMLSIHSDLAADADHAEPAPGTYTVDVTGSYAKFTLDNRFTRWSATDDSGKQAASGTVTEGTLTLEKGQDGSYRATARLTTDAGERCKVTWDGPIRWINNTTPPYADQRLEAQHALVSYYGTDAVRNPDTDMWSLELYDDLEQATQGMFIRCYTPVSDTPLNPQLPVGTFTVAEAGSTEAWHYMPGEILLTERSGTYLIVIAKGHQQDYYCTGGTIVVSAADGEYSITCDLTTNYDTRITGGYTGPIAVTNEFMPLVQEDLTVNCDRVYQNKLTCFAMGNTYNYNFMLCDTEFTEPNVPDNGGPANIVSFDLYTDVAPVDGMRVIPDGTYTLGGGMRAGQLSKGFTYGIHYNEKGKQCQKITFSEGTLTVSSTDGVYSMVLDCLTNQGYRFVCNYEGELPFGSKIKSSGVFADKDPWALVQAASPVATFGTGAASGKAQLRRPQAARMGSGAKLLLQDAL